MLRYLLHHRLPAWLISRACRLQWPRCRLTEGSLQVIVWPVNETLALCPRKRWHLTAPKSFFEGNNRLFVAQACGHTGDRAVLQETRQWSYAADEPHYSFDYLFRWNVANCSGLGYDKWAQMHVWVHVRAFMKLIVILAQVLIKEPIASKLRAPARVWSPQCRTIGADNILFAARA